MSNSKKSLSLAEKIKSARKLAGLSQRQLGTALKVSDKAVSSYEVGRAVPPVETLKEISQVTYTPMSYFLEDDSTRKEQSIEEKIALIERELQEIKLLLRKK